jgi:hypothetical protein
MHRQADAITAAFHKYFYNGTTIDDCRRMQKLEMPNSLRLLKVEDLPKIKPRTIQDGCRSPAH